MAERYQRPGSTRCRAVWLRHEDTPGGNWGEGNSVRCGLHAGHGDDAEPDPMAHGHEEVRGGEAMAPTAVWVWWPPHATVVTIREEVRRG